LLGLSHALTGAFACMHVTHLSFCCSSCMLSWMSLMSACSAAILRAWLPSAWGYLLLASKSLASRDMPAHAHSVHGVHGEFWEYRTQGPEQQRCAVVCSTWGLSSPRSNPGTQHMGAAVSPGTQGRTALQAVFHSAMQIKKAYTHACTWLTCCPRALHNARQDGAAKERG